MMLGAMWGMFAAAERYKANADRALTAPEGFLGPLALGAASLPLRRLDHRLQLLGRRQHRLVALVGKRSSSRSSASE